MRRFIATFAALIVCTAPGALAQSGLAIKGGLSFGDVTNRGALPGNLSTRTGFAAGIALPLLGGDPLSLNVEGLYAQRGVGSSSDTSSRRLDYIDVPAYLRFTLPLPALAPFIYAGPQISFETKCRAGASACPDDGRPKTTYAGVLGAGVRLGSASGFSLEGRYIYGLTDLKLSTVTTSSSYKTRSFLILMGFGF
ncbi:MAG TPA: porin family protein [Gemmatimonadales bacterium]